MNIISEIEKTRNRLVNEINREMDLLLERVKGQLDVGEEIFVEKSFESIYPLTDNPAFFKGKKPTAVIFDKRRVEVHTWRKVVQTIMQDCISDKRRKALVFSMCGKIAGNKRVILSTNDDTMDNPLKIDENLYLESQYDVETMLKILTLRILEDVGYDYTKISIALRNK